MSKYSTIIVEDDPMSQKSMELICSKIEDIDLKSVFSDASSALEYVKKENVDLIFLDVEMPGMTGIEFLESLDHLPQVVMTTSNPEYAVDAFEYSLTDFLQKPVTLPKIQGAMEKVRKADGQLQELASLSFYNEIYIKVDGRFVRIPIDSIFYFENVGDYVKVITQDATHVIYSTLKSLDQKLQHPRLLKVHRSFIINLSKIKDIEDNSIVMDNKKIVPVSRAHKSQLMSSLNIL